MPEVADSLDQAIALDDELRVYRKEQVKVMLGNISNATYYRILQRKLLPFSRLFPGGPAVHTKAQLQEYIDYLNGHAVGRVQGNVRPIRKAS